MFTHGCTTSDTRFQTTDSCYYREGSLLHDSHFSCHVGFSFSFKRSVHNGFSPAMKGVRFHFDQTYARSKRGLVTTRTRWRGREAPLCGKLQPRSLQEPQGCLPGPPDHSAHLCCPGDTAGGSVVLKPLSLFCYRGNSSALPQHPSPSLGIRLSNGYLNG